MNINQNLINMMKNKFRSKCRCITKCDNITYFYCFSMDTWSNLNDSCHGTIIVMSDCTIVTSEQHLYQTIAQFDRTIVLPRKLATRNIHDYLFSYYWVFLFEDWDNHICDNITSFYCFSMDTWSNLNENLREFQNISSGICIFGEFIAMTAITLTWHRV